MLLELLQGHFDPQMFIAWIIALIIALTVHEFAHALRADQAGDPTARASGRVSLNPLAHYDPVGSTLILLVGFGWGKPVPVNPFRFRNPRRDQVMVSFWGPLSNLIAAAVLSIPLLLHAAGPYTGMLFIFVQVQVSLAIFNLIPVPPLDGSHILSGLLPITQARRLDAVYSQYGMVLLLPAFLLANAVIPAVIGLLAMLLLR